MSLKLTRRKGTGVWQISGTIAGERVRESTGTAERAIAEEIRVKREGELHRAAIYGPAAVKTWGEAILRYEEVNQPAAGQAALLSRITKHFGPMLLLKDIGQDRIDAAVRALCAPDAAPATKLRNVIGPVRAVMMMAARRQWCAVPTFEVPEGSSGVKRTRWLTPDEFCRLRDATAPHIRPLVIFLVGTGSRLGSALALDWRDVDLIHGRATLRDTKNGRDHTVDLPPAAVAAMAMIEGREGRVFRTDDGAPYPASDSGGGQIRTAWATACRTAGFPGAWQGSKPNRWWTPADVTPHVLRHTWASWRYAFHRDILRLKAEGDWSSVALVERYAKLVPDGMLPGIMAAWGMSGTPLAQDQRSIA